MQKLSSVSSIEHIEKSLKLVSKTSDLAVLNAAMDMTDNVRRESHREENLSNSLDFELLVNTTREAELLNHCNIPSILESNSSSDFISDSSASIDAPLVPSGVCQKVSCTLLCGYGAHSNRALLHHKTSRKLSIQCCWITEKEKHCRLYKLVSWINILQESQCKFSIWNFNLVSVWVQEKH